MNTQANQYEYLEGQLCSGIQVPVLDHGFVRLVDKMGDDAAIVQAARTSYGKGTKTTSEDQGLINHLMRNQHTTPFEMCELKFHVKLPIMIARQWIRHRTWSFNEYSCRYSEVPDAVYVPDPSRIAVQSSTNKQGSGDTVIGRAADGFLNVTGNVQSVSAQAIAFGEKFNIARELNRINMTVAHYTEWYCKVDLHNLLGFLRLRLDSHAQWEFQEYARVIAAMVAELYPMTWQAFVQYRACAATFSLLEQQYILQSGLSMSKLIDDAIAVEPPDGFGKTEWHDFKKKLLTMKTNVEDSQP